MLAQPNGGHNFAFTTEFHTTFTYLAANNDTFGFTGDDDVFVFINKTLAIDLGGVHGAESASVSLNSLGLADGKDYALDVFQAERHTTQSNFTITTSLQLANPEPTIPEPASPRAACAGPDRSGTASLSASAFKQRDPGARLRDFLVHNRQAEQTGPTDRQ